jgi:hypothetical protein
MARTFGLPTLLVVTIGVLAMLTAITVAPGARTAHAATAGIPNTVPTAVGRWSLIGADVPFLRWGCDFGCPGDGVRAHELEVDRMLRTMSERGVRVARWYLFPGAATQVTRAADGTPTGVDEQSLLDLDLAVHLAAKHDVYLLPVVLPSPAAVPLTWFTDPLQGAALAQVLTPMFARYRDSPNLLGWELTTATDQLVDAGAATPDQLRASATGLVQALHATAKQPAIAGPSDVSRLDLYTGLGFDAYAPQATAAIAGERCAICRTVASLVNEEGVDAPVFIGGFTSASDTQASLRLQSFAGLGYAGALAWSWRGAPAPDAPDTRTQMPDTATWKWHYSHPRSGPRTRPLNPCIGPKEAAFRCPNLRMSTPSNLSLGLRHGRRVLFSANSVNSYGLGPASIRGTRNGRFTMSAVQLLHRRHGSPMVIRTGAALLFKAVPGQYRYWKWNGAARMELWRLDSTGTPIEIARTGPKTVYCLRDLKHTRGSLPRSPGSAVYPGCNQSLATRSVTLGTSVGWSDIYPATYNENWVDVQGLRGCFSYVHIADPTNAIYESNEHDNASSVVVKLPWTGSNKGCPGAKTIPTTGVGGIY